MNIQLSPQQESLIQRKVQTGKYHSPEEVIDLALQLLDEYEQTDAEWIEDIREKIDAAILESEKNTPIDGESFVNKMIDHFQKMRD